ncbi:MAG TPA: pirin family protein [Burkholderiales bacterium]|nr:pirin family protein [Burkholderiales bacterium]
MQTNATKPGTRSVTQVVRGQRSSDGAGVRLSRVIGGRALPDLDPFLLFDEFRSDEASDYIGGFPDHPHRGFETVTYMLAGRMRHGDNKGNTGLLVPGSVQWMTAGRGIVHSEMPEQEDGLMWGFQLWVNLPAKDKMTAPRYQDIAPGEIPEVDAGNGIRVRVIAGRFRNVSGPVSAVATDPLYLDVALPAGASLEVPLPEDDNAFAYVFEGAARVGGEQVARGELAVLGNGEQVELAAGPEGARLVVIAGRPLNEPVAKYGPFVMNTADEIRQAVYDYQSGKF